MTRKLIIIIIGVCFSSCFPSQEETCIQGISMYKKMSFSGEVIKKGGGKTSHKMALFLKGDSLPVVFDPDTGGIYSYIRIGDYLEKKPNELKLTLTRNNYDSVMHFKFRCPDSMNKL